ncbi:MAG: stage II sporulation protein R [Lachnospiraceae bacterium]
MNLKKDGFLSLICFLMALLLFGVYVRNTNEATADRIAPQILRFHVLANSDRSEDQQLKLEVRTLLLNSMYDDLGVDTTKNDTKNYVLENQTQLELLAEAYMEEKGYDYQAHIEVTEDYFPEKTYGDMTFPCGTYEAVRVTLGKGNGRNWWCVLYPPLCFTDSTYAVVPDASKETLKSLISEDDFSSLMISGGDRSRIQVEFKLAQMFSQ